MRRAALLLVVAGALLAPATPAFAHGGQAVDGTAYRIRITGISTPEKGLAIRTVEAGAQLELTNRTGHSVEVLGYSGEPYLDIRPDGTYQNVNSPAANPLGDPTAPPSWRHLSTATTVRWHDERVYRLQGWTVPLREQARTFELRGTTAWQPPPPAWLWWSGAGLLALALTALASRWPGPVTLIAGLTPISYAISRAVDGGTAPVVLIAVGLLALAAAWRHPPFFLALSGTALAVFGGLTSTAVFSEAVIPAAGPAWLARTSVLIPLAAGTALAVTGLRRLRAALPASPPTASAERSAAATEPTTPSATATEPTTPSATAEPTAQRPAAATEPTAKPSVTAEPATQPSAAATEPTVRR